MILRSFVLIEKEGSYLLIREAARKWQERWFLPGGKANLHELPETAAHREVKEEAGCDVNIQGLFYIKYKKGFLDDHLSLFYAATIAGEEILKQTPDKHSLEVKWFTHEETLRLPLRGNLANILANYNKNSLIPVENFKIV